MPNTETDTKAGASRLISITSAIVLIALAVVFIGILAIDLVTYPPYAYAFGLPRTWQGGIEAIVVAGLLAGAQFIRRPALCLGVMLAVSELYLRRHGVDIAAAIDLVYTEILVGLGCGITRCFEKQNSADSETYLKYLLLGVAAWSACAWTLSAISFGSLKDLRILTLAIGILVLAGKPSPVSAFVIRRTLKQRGAARVAIAFLYSWFLVLFAKTSVAIGFDSLWYGLRGEHVLVGEGSAFASAGLVSAVYYFPKLYELLLIPVSGLGSSSVIAGMSIFMTAFFALACNAILLRLDVRTLAIRVLATLACVTLPLISNSAIEPKPDLFAGLLMMMAWLFAYDFFAARRTSAMLWAVAAGLLATQAKLVTIPFVAGLGMSYVCIAVFARARHSVCRISHTPDKTARIALGLAAVTILFTAARTLLLTGLPTIGPDVLFRIWEKLGFDLRFPAGTLSWISSSDWRDSPFLAIDLLFAPQFLPHIITYWTGNIWLWSVCAISILASISSEPPHGSRRIFASTGMVLSICGAALMFGVSYATRGGDGNYFISAVAPATLVGLASVWRRLSGPALKICGGCVIAFALFQAGFSFVSADWMTGTRELDTRFGIGFHTFRRENREMLRAHGLAQIDLFLRHIHPTPRVLGCMQDDLDMRISARTESMQQIAFSRPEFLLKPTAFLHFLQDDKIRFVIVPRPGNTDAFCYDTGGVRESLHSLSVDEHVRTIEDSGFIMYDLSNWRAPTDR